MAQPLFSLDEILAMLKTADVSPAKVAAFKRQAEFVWTQREGKRVDEVFVQSGFGVHSRKGFVELSVNEQRIQMDVRKAREISGMLIECASAAAGDEAIMLWLQQHLDIQDPEKLGRILYDLRQLRQGGDGGKVQ